MTARKSDVIPPLTTAQLRAALHAGMEYFARARGDQSPQLLRDALIDSQVSAVRRHAAMHEASRIAPILTPRANAYRVRDPSDGSVREGHAP